jgi:enoyl-CoA hydratase/carnithine racemase
MALDIDQKEPGVLVERYDSMMAIILNRPRVINALTTEMIRLIRQALDEAKAENRFQFVLLSGTGSRGFCAGGDIKRLAKAVGEKAFWRAELFFHEEYALDLYLHRFPKPVIVIADGITMGGGLGLSAGADLVVATESTVMAMPETRIGFFPDVGATGWMFTKCPMGCPEYLGLTGYEVTGAECIRLGLANGLTGRARLQELKEALTNHPAKISSEKGEAVGQLNILLNPFLEKKILPSPEMDEWVKTHFSGKTAIQEIMDSLLQCDPQTRWCEDTYRQLSQRSPTALVLTLKLLRHNEGRPLEEVFPAEEQAAHFMIRHPDYLEGIRAHILDKDDQPRWQPPTIDEVPPLEVA